MAMCVWRWLWFLQMGGGRKQFQVLADLHKMHQYDVALGDIEDALRESNINVAGGYVDNASQELIVRGLGRIKSVEEIRDIVVKTTDDRPVLIDHVAEIREGAQTKRGDSSVNGKDAVVIVVQKQPESDTRQLTEEIREALAGIGNQFSRHIGHILSDFRDVGRRVFLGIGHPRPQLMIGAGDSHIFHSRSLGVSLVVSCLYRPAPHYDAQINEHMNVFLAQR